MFVCKLPVKMAALLFCCSVVEQRCVIHVLWSEGVTASEIYSRILAQYGEHCVAQKNGHLLHENARLHSAAAATEALR
jgi:predicted metal-binding transcription factor (methanogenesis marker protein 9)